MPKSRTEVLLALARGLLCAIALTLAGMAVIAVLVVHARASDGTIRALNQLLKCAAIVLGTTASVGRGGRRGFVSGMVLAILYMALGYAMAVALGGNAFQVPGMLGEMLIGAAIGATCGAICSNLPARRARSRAARGAH